MFHELHCLRAMRNTIEIGWKTIGHSRQAHILHCFNYLRQWTLCAADVTLEPGDFFKRGISPRVEPEGHIPALIGHQHTR